MWNRLQSTVKPVHMAVGAGTGIRSSWTVSSFQEDKLPNPSPFRQNLDQPILIAVEIAGLIHDGAQLLHGGHDLAVSGLQLAVGALEQRR